ncbi:unnamed protein product [Dicrocoelium dendriticum]|nr:unnamed protein product [Dicrocoelium dendriticum]
MYLLRIVMLTFLMKPFTGELFSIGVRLITNATHIQNKRPCSLLLDSRMSAYVLGGFVNCESLYISSTYSDMGMRVVMLRTGIQFHGIPLVSIAAFISAPQSVDLCGEVRNSCLTLPKSAYIQDYHG